MINARPKTSTLFSIIVFLIIVFGAFAYALMQFLSDTKGSMFILILMYSSGPIGIAVLLKTVWGIKIVKITKERFEIRYPFRLQKFRFTGKDIQSWHIETIKTFGGKYEEMTVNMNTNRKITLSKQEHTDYDKARKYMEKKFKKLKK